MTCLILPPLTFLAKTLGCRTNQAEIETISERLMVYGFRQYTSSTLPLFHSPALIILNTCVVTSKAEKETRKEIRSLRKKYPNAFLVVLGCGVTTREKFNSRLPQANLFIPNENKNNATKLILEVLHLQFRASTTPNDRVNQLKAKWKNKYQVSGRKFIKIQDGCYGGCSFCLTQFVRGKPTSVPLKKIIEEINFWVGKGIKEVILTGINIGLYGNDHSNQRSHLSISLKERPFGTTIADLITKILEETKIERLTFSSIYPEMLTETFLKLVVGNPRITQCFHLSLQSGSQSVLKRMNRKTNLNELIKKLQWIKEKNPFFTFRADIITGFPEETEKEFQETLEFIKNARISFAHIFTYSARKGTPAYEMINVAKRSPSEARSAKEEKWQDLPESLKKERSRKIRTVVEKNRKEEVKKMIGQSLQCLFVRQGKDLWEGITENGWNIRIKNLEFRIKNLKGKISSIKITGFENDYLFGEIVGLPTKGTKTSGISTEPSAF